MRISDWSSDVCSSDLRERGMLLDKPENFESGSGIGVRGQVAGRQLALGNTTLMEQIGVSVAALVPQAEALRAEGASVMHLAIHGPLMGLLAVSVIGRQS